MAVTGIASTSPGGNYGRLPAEGALALREWLRAYIAYRTDVKPQTREKYVYTAEELLSFLGGGTPLSSVTPGQAEAFCVWLKATRNLAPLTVLSHCRRARLFFEAAVRRALINQNPFAKVRPSVEGSPDRLYFVTRKEADAVLKACPTAELRLIFALCRYGGLRCPSEIVRLQWKDVDWERKRFTVHCPKTEHLRHGGVRQVPIFPEIYPHLRTAHEDVEEEAEHIIIRYRHSARKLYRYLREAIFRAGLRPWPKLFQNLRSTRQTELAAELPLQVVCTWMGNSWRTAAGHYLQVTESHYERAAASKDAAVSVPDPSALPEVLTKGWANLPEHIKTIILALVHTSPLTHT